MKFNKNNTIIINKYTMETKLNQLCSEIKNIKYDNYDTIEQFVKTLDDYEERVKLVEKEMKQDNLEEIYSTKDITELFHILDNINIEELTFDDLRKIRIITNIIEKKLSSVETTISYV